MRRAAAGDSAAFAVLTKRYQHALRRVALSRLGSVEAAEDVVQETFLAAYKSRHTYDERFGFRTWLWTILLNECRRHAGRQARRPRLVSLRGADHLDEIAPEQSTTAATGVTALSGLLAAERREVLESLLQRLSPVQADALRLRFFGGLKFQEIADTMLCSLCTAKNRVRGGLLRLAELLQGEAADEASARMPRSPLSVPVEKTPASDPPLPSKEQQR